MRSTTTWPWWIVAGSSGSGSGEPLVEVTIPIPSDVALTTRSAAPRSRWSPTRPRGPASAAARTAGSGERLMTATSAAPTSPSARATARPAPPAPTTTHRSPAGSTPPSSRSASTNPAPSVLSPTSRSPCQYTQLTAPSSAATAVRSSTAPWAAALWGMVTDSPAMPSVRAAATAAAPPPSGTSKARYTQSASAAAKAALRTAGDSEWRAGDPIRAASRVDPLITRAQPGPIGPAASPAPQTRRLALVLGIDELVVVGREHVGPVVGVGVEHVVQPVTFGGRQRRLDAGPTGRRNGRRRQPLAVAGVVGRVGRQVGLGESAARLTLVEAARGVDLQRHLVGQSVVDHARHLGAVLVDPRLLLDQRRHNQHLVRRIAQPLGPGLHIELGQYGVELRHHALDHHRLGVALLDLVALGEQRALERRLVAGQEGRPRLGRLEGGAEPLGREALDPVLGIGQPGHRLRHGVPLGHRDQNGVGRERPLLERVDGLGERRVELHPVVASLERPGVAHADVPVPHRRVADHAGVGQLLANVAGRRTLRDLDEDGFARLARRVDPALDPRPGEPPPDRHGQHEHRERYEHGPASPPPTQIALLALALVVLVVIVVVVGVVAIGLLGVALSAVGVGGVGHRLRTGRGRPGPDGPRGIARGRGARRQTRVAGRRTLATRLGHRRTVAAAARVRIGTPCGRRVALAAGRDGLCRTRRSVVQPRRGAPDRWGAGRARLVDRTRRGRRDVRRLLAPARRAPAPPRRSSGAPRLQNSSLTSRS